MRLRVGRLTRQPDRKISLQETAALGAEAESLKRNVIWQHLVGEIESYQQSVAAELVKCGSHHDEEKRAMIYALNVVLDYPRRLVENGQRAQRALREADERKRFAEIETIGQAVETLGVDLP